jgi:cell division protein FtsL
MAKRGAAVINVVLALALVVSALWLVNRAQERSRTFDALARAQKLQLQLDAEYARLEAERDSAAASGVVTAVATKRLKMTRPVQTVHTSAPAGEGAADTVALQGAAPAPARPAGVQR